MNLDSQVKIQVAYFGEPSIAEVCEEWTDGEIAELLENDPEAIAAFIEETLDWVLNTDPLIQEIEVDGKEIR